MVLCKPEFHSLVVGKVTHQNEYGVFASIGGAMTVYIPGENLMKPSFL